MSVYYKEEYAKGDPLCDMHYGLTLPTNLELVSWVKFETKAATKTVEELLGKHPGNKILAVFADLPSFGGNYDIAACYSYDGTTLGFVTTKYRA